MRLEIDSKDWLEKLESAIPDTNEGDTIVLKLRSQAEVGERMRLKMCPNREIDFEYAEDDLEDLND